MTSSLKVALNYAYKNYYIILLRKQNLYVHSENLNITGEFISLFSLFSYIYIYIPKKPTLGDSSQNATKGRQKNYIH